MGTRRALKDYNRDELAVATKVYIPMREGPNGGGLSRKHIMPEIDNSPLASGKLARDWSETTKRTQTDKVMKMKYGATEDADKPIAERVAELAKKRGVPMSHIATAWILQKDPVAAPIIGATKPSHIEQAAAALPLTLTAEEAAYLEEPYVPHKVVGALSP